MLEGMGLTHSTCPETGTSRSGVSYAYTEESSWVSTWKGVWPWFNSGVRNDHGLSCQVLRQSTEKRIPGVEPRLVSSKMWTATFPSNRMLLCFLVMGGASWATTGILQLQEVVWFRTSPLKIIAFLWAVHWSANRVCRVPLTPQWAAVRYHWMLAAHEIWLMKASASLCEGVLAAHGPPSM